MSLDPRRSAGGLWLAWVAAGALGGALATLLSLAWLGSWLNGNPDELTSLAYGILFTTVAAAFQYAVLRFAGGRNWAAALWLPATAVAYVVYLRLDEAWMMNAGSVASWVSSKVPSLDLVSTINAIMDANVVTYALAYGAVQGLVLALMTGRKPAFAIWIGGALLGLIASLYIPGLIPLTANTPGVMLMASSASFTGSYAMGTGLALIVILRMRRHVTAPPAPAIVPTLQGEG